MTEMITWLRAQLDTDEQAALAANVKQDDPEWWVSPVAGTGGEHFTVRSRRDNRPIARVQRLDGDGDEPAGILSGASVALHIANHDVARVLRQVQAHRAILDLYEELYEPHLYEACQHLAAIYSDRDGFRAEWSA